MNHETRATTRELVELAWPIAAAMLGETALGLSDTKLVGSLGAAALGGVGMATILLFLAYSLLFGMMRGVKVRAAYAIGEGRPEDAIRYANAGALMGVVAGVGVWAITRDVTPLLEALGVESSMVAPARDFVAARAWGAVGTCAGAALINYLQGVGDSRTPMVIGIAGNVVNVAFAYTLIHGRLGLPALGVRGAGLATATTEVLELVALLAVVRMRRRRSERTMGETPTPPLRAVSARSTLSIRAAAREVAALGVPTGLHFMLEATAFTTFIAILGSFGATQMAAHQIAFNTMRASFLPGIAISEAASVLVARSLGGRRLDEADRVTHASLALGVGFMTACGVAFALFGANVASFFADDAEVIAVARRLFLVAAVFQTLDAVQMILRGSLRGAKDVRWVAAVGTTVAWVCVPGSAFLFGRVAGLGVVGGWLGFVFETTVASALLWRRWSRGGWRADFGGAVGRQASAVRSIDEMPAENAIRGLPTGLTAEG